MKALVALLILYIGTFFIVIQSASQNSVQAAPQAAASTQGQPTAAQQKSVDPAKDADIRSLIELLGMHDAVQNASGKGTEQYREALLASVPDNERGQAFINAFVGHYQKKFNPDDVAEELVTLYDKHFTDDDIKGLLQFYGSPLGQKYASEVPKLNAEAQAAARALSLRAAKEVLQDLRKEYPVIGAQARLNKSTSGQQGQVKQQAQAQPNSVRP